MKGLFMYTLPTVELLETTHAFPTEYMFKAIGKSDRGFVARAVAAVREELKLDVDPPYHSRDAVGGRHVSVTVEPFIETPDDVIAVYRRLAKLDGVVLLL
jgi:putative lipoic acid-binding regulatory protein